jgi:hypothetical protein
MSRLATTLAVIAAAAIGVLAGARPGVAQEASRYPYDPVCPWGRLSNGRGMLVRCITKAEAAALPAGVRAPSGPTAPTASTAPAAAASAAASASATPGASAPAGGEPPAALTASQFTLKSITVSADDGKLPVAEKKLAQGKDKMLECLAKHGGLDKTEGQVDVRFLVRARGRAEGVSVAKRSGVSAAAAECIAHVVDRRPVGTPAAPMVGATASLRFTRSKT